ncbi:MAG: hypothetical protein ACE5L6_08215 [Candidatus Bathyarchaeia archaeon]
MKTLKLKALTILGLAMITALVATTFAVYSYAAPTKIRAANEEYGEMSGEHNEMHNHWEEMHDKCTEMMDEILEEEYSSTMHNEVEESHHGCH